MLTNSPALVPDVCLRPTEAAKMLGIGKTTFWKLAKEDPDFPCLFNLTPGVTVVLKSHVDQFIARRLAASGGQKSAA